MERYRYRLNRRTAAAILALPTGLFIFSSLLYARSLQEKLNQASGYYQDAEQARASLEETPEEQRSEKDYLRVVRDYRRVYSAAPTSPHNAKSLLAIGELYRTMAAKFEKKKYFASAVETYDFLLKEYPHSQYRAAALLSAAAICQSDLKQPEEAQRRFKVLLETHPRSSQAEKARVALSQIETELASAPLPAPPAAPKPADSAKQGEPVQAAPAAAVSAAAEPQKRPEEPATRVAVTDVRQWNSPYSTRLVIDLGAEVKYGVGRLSNPPRVFVDLYGTKINRAVSRAVSQKTTGGGGPVKSVRAAQNTLDVTRVVAELNDQTNYAVFELPNPYRVVVEIRHSLKPVDSETSADSASNRGAGAPAAPFVSEKKTVETAAASRSRTPSKPLSGAAEKDSSPSITENGSTEQAAFEKALGIKTASAKVSPAEAKRDGVVAGSNPQMGLTMGPALGSAPGSVIKDAEKTGTAAPEKVQATQQKRQDDSPTKAAHVRLSASTVAESDTATQPAETKIDVVELPKPAVAGKAAAVAEKIPSSRSKRPSVATSLSPDKAPGKDTAPTEQAASAQPNHEDEISQAPSVEKTNTNGVVEPSPAAQPSPGGRVKAAVKAAKSDKISAKDSGKAAEPAATSVRTALPNRDGSRSLTRALGLKIGRIILDPGHGGHDTGTIGPSGFYEKDLVLDVALRLGKLITERLGSQVVYTRQDDTFIPLESRTAIANEQQADLFLSIHANSSASQRARGIETYYLSFATDPEALEVAARENAVSQESIHELQDLVKKIALNEKLDESKEFASEVQTALHTRLSKDNRQRKDRGVKKAPFMVLVGARMPSVLAEIAFLSNPQEEKLLKTKQQRQKIAEALYAGIAKYADTLSGVKVARTVNISQSESK